MSYMGGLGVWYGCESWWYVSRPSKKGRSYNRDWKLSCGKPCINRMEVCKQATLTIHLACLSYVCSRDEVCRVAEIVRVRTIQHCPGQKCRHTGLKETLVELGRADNRFSKFHWLDLIEIPIGPIVSDRQLARVDRAYICMLGNPVSLGVSDQRLIHPILQADLKVKPSPKPPMWYTGGKPDLQYHKPLVCELTDAIASVLHGQDNRSGPGRGLRSLGIAILWLVLLNSIHYKLVGPINGVELLRHFHEIGLVIRKLPSQGTAGNYCVTILEVVGPGGEPYECAKVSSAWHSPEQVLVLLALVFTVEFDKLFRGCNKLQLEYAVDPDTTVMRKRAESPTKRKT
ncbi:hypothetical protein AG1IA_08433 [Rhizoctonia solani AG-1 IA]|uniref:Uncharacterized protein n=1 Tax=Thanatephorus cucumeris (strain AG1-IA) TaxID=983506 RepID=L8WHV7_THACA|nr:hypothetical protein AG1IA_08433 [Rhizoctonia solani AG-1 IA]